MTVSYDGTGFNGWQKQGNTENTVQEKLENVLSRMADKPVDVNGAGRTDAGVHAAAQVASFKLGNYYEPDEIIDYVNRYLPV